MDYGKLSYVLLATAVASALLSLGVAQFVGYVDFGMDILFILAFGILILGVAGYNMLQKGIRDLPRERHQELAKLFKSGLSVPYLVVVGGGFVVVLYIYVENIVLKATLVLLWTSIVALQYAVYMFHEERSGNVEKE